MINWDNFYVFATLSVGLWLAGAVFALRSSTRSRMAVGFTIAGIMVLGIFIAGLWEYLQRPPLRTMGARPPCGHWEKRVYGIHSSWE